MVSDSFAQCEQRGLSANPNLESVIQIENVIQNFVLKYAERGFYCDLTWNKVYLFPVNF